MSAKKSIVNRKSLIGKTIKANRQPITHKQKTVLSVPVYSLASARESGTLSLPKEYFGAKINKALLAQALRVYLTNQKSHWSSTKTRGEVEGSTRKIYRQKGTGRARHGGVRAPIFVGGGIALGPSSRKVVLDLPKKMKKLSLISALSDKASSGEVLGLSGLEKATGKTKEFVQLARKLWQVSNGKKEKSILIITSKNNNLASRAVGNIRNIKLLPASQLNAYEVIAHHFLVFTKDAVDLLKGEQKNA